MVNATSGLFEVEEPTRARPTQAVPTPQVQGSEDDLTQVAGAALWGPQLDRLELVGVADELELRRLGPGGMWASGSQSASISRRWAASVRSVLARCSGPLRAAVSAA